MQCLLLYGPLLFHLKISLIISPLPCTLSGQAYLVNFRSLPLQHPRHYLSFPTLETGTGAHFPVPQRFQRWRLGSHLCLYLSDHCKSPIQPIRVPYRDFQTQSLGQKEKSTRSENMEADKPIALQIDARSPWARTLRNAEVGKRY